MRKRIHSEIEELEREASLPINGIRIKLSEPGFVDVHTLISVQKRYDTAKSKSFYEVAAVKVLKDDDGNDVFEALLERVER